MPQGGEERKSGQLLDFSRLVTDDYFSKPEPEEALLHCKVEEA